tara:strand:+ start:3609 stop:4208 length:600 start_codon:yes stop_codon:yes gene_type:complete
MANVKTHELFPTLLHEFSLKINKYDSIQMKNYIKHNKKNESLYQTEDDIHITSFFQTFRNHIFQVNKNVLDKLELEYEGINITNMWGNVMRNGANHPPHTHSNNFLSGVFYLDAGDEVSPIQFFDPRPQSSVLVPRRKKSTIYNSSMMQFRAITNVGYVFPSWLQHWVPPTEKERISISWNIQVKGYYGEPKTLQNAYI